MFRNFSHTDLSVLETYSNTVAPHAGAWIETSSSKRDRNSNHVVPCNAGGE